MAVTVGFESLCDEVSQGLINVRQRNHVDVDLSNHAVDVRE
jgi:hypothetical protein